MNWLSELITIWGIRESIEAQTYRFEKKMDEVDKELHRINDLIVEKKNVQPLYGTW